jgi:hypothetical protein
VTTIRNNSTRYALYFTKPRGPASVLAVIERYRKIFDQQSVLWETARVCVAS